MPSSFDLSQLTNPKITNFSESIYAPMQSKTYIIDLQFGTIQMLTTIGDTTIYLPNPVGGKHYTLMIVYGGTHTLTWVGGTQLSYSIRWPGGIVPMPTSIAGKIDFYNFFSDGIVTYGQDGGRNF